MEAVVDFLSPMPFAGHGHQKAIYEKTLHLEDLLELQQLQDPVSEPGPVSMPVASCDL